MGMMNLEQAFNELHKASKVYGRHSMGMMNLEQAFNELHKASSDAGDDGQWITVNGTHIHLNSAGTADKGPKEVVDRHNRLTATAHNVAVQAIKDHGKTTGLKEHLARMDKEKLMQAHALFENRAHSPEAKLVASRIEHELDERADRGA